MHEELPPSHPIMSVAAALVVWCRGPGVVGAVAQAKPCYVLGGWVGLVGPASMPAWCVFILLSRRGY